jgi:fibronectin-binding autotransporter adhesin
MNSIVMNSLLETLEPRIAPAGIVNLTTANGVLTVTGTSDSNNILIYESAPGEWRVMESAPGGTLFSLNGNTAQPDQLMPAQNSIRVNLLGGAVDDLQLSNLTLSGDVTVTGGDGADNVVMFNTHIGGKLTADLGNDIDYLGFDALSSIGGAVSLKMGAGSDTVLLNGGTYGAGMTVDLGKDGNTFLSISTATIFGNLSISNSGSLANTQTVSLGGSTSVGGNVTIKSTTSQLSLGIALGGGENVRIGGSVTIQGSAANDMMNLGNQVFIGGALNVQAGNGTNYLAQSTGTLVVGSLKYTGGSGDDSVTFGGTSFVTGAGASINFGAGASNRLELTCSSSVKIAGGLALTGGTGAEDLIVQTPLLTISGALSFNAAAGNNSMTFKPVIGKVGSMSYTGGSGDDAIDIGDYTTGSVTRITVGGGMTVSVAGGNTFVNIRDTIVQGALRVTSSSVSGLSEWVRIHESTILGKTDVNLTGTAGSLVAMDDSTILGAATISTGAGNDIVNLEKIATGTNLLTFAGPVRVLLGADDDSFGAGMNPFSVNHGVNFLGTLFIDGGKGTDGAGFQLGYGNAFAVPATTAGLETVT